MRKTLPCCFSLLMLGLSTVPAGAELPPLVPREVLFGNPEKVNPKLSPDGTRLAWLAPDARDVLQVWVKTLGKGDAKSVTADKKQGIRRYFWAEDNVTLLYLQDVDGDENFHVFGVDLASGNVRDLTPFQGVRSDVVGVEPRVPGQILVTLNLRKREVFDVYRVDLETGAVDLDTENPGDVAEWIVDPNLVVRGAQLVTSDGGTEIRVRDSQKGKWRTLVAAPMEEDVAAFTFSADGSSLLLTSSIGFDTTHLFWRNLKTGKAKEIAFRNDVDVGPVQVHPLTGVVEAVGFAHGRLEWTVVDPAIQPDFAAIPKLAEGDFGVISRDRSDHTWLVSFNLDKGAIRYFVWDRKKQVGAFLFSHQPKLDGLTLATTRPIQIRARDGLVLPAYLTLPPGVSPKGLPMVLLVHGGPWARDSWGYNAMRQWLANRGYAVLQVNFRGSTGFGKRFLHAGDKQWALKMHDDLIDGVNWAVAEGIADAKRIAIMGGSYGGYSALAGAAFTPDSFKCGVDIVGPANLLTLLASIPPYWKPLLGLFHSRVGDPNNPAERKLLEAASPLNSAHRIRIPLLIGQGANDPRVKPAESEQIVAAIEKNQGRVTYVLYPDEGHGFQRPENRTDFNARAEVFLGECLGGRVELLKGERIPGSTAVVKVIGGTK